MKYFRIVWLILIVVICNGSVYGEQNVWRQIQKKQGSTLSENDTQFVQKYTVFNSSGSDSQFSPYFFNKYDSEFQATRIPLYLSDRELAISFVLNPSSTIKETLESENLFIFVPNDFKCRHLQPTSTELQTSNDIDSLYADYHACRASLANPIPPFGQTIFNISSSIPDEELEAYLGLTSTPYDVWQVYRRFHSTDEEVLEQIERLRKNSNIAKVWEVFYSPLDPKKVEPSAPNGEITVIFGEDVTAEQIRLLNLKYGTRTMSESNSIYKLEVIAGGGITSLQVAEQYRQDPQVLLAAPDFKVWLGPFAPLPPEPQDIFLAEGKYRIDFNKNGEPDFEDFILFAASFDSRIGDRLFHSRSDLDGDGHITFLDFIHFVRIFSIGK